MSAFIDIEPSRYYKRKGHGVTARKSLPFVEALGGKYAHRVRHVTLHTCGGKSHFAVACWCGMHLNIAGSGKGKGQLKAIPSEGRPLCATCEGRVIGAGLLGDREIAGRAVMFRPNNAVTIRSAE